MPSQAIAILGAAAAPLLALAACSPAPVYPDAGGGGTIFIHGRVVDFESCASWDRCSAVAGLEVRLRTMPDRVSAPTTAPGRFRLESPAAREDDLLVTTPGGLPGAYAPTLNPWAAPPALSDVYGVELHALPLGRNSDGNPTILTALGELAGAERVDLVAQGGYLGQVLRRDSEGLHAVRDARVEVVLPSDWPPHEPAPVVRFVQNVPRYSSGPLLYEEGYAATGPFGIFLIPAAGRSAVLTVRVQAGETIFGDMIAQVVPGTVTLGLHVP